MKRYKAGKYYEPPKVGRKMTEEERKKAFTAVVLAMGSGMGFGNNYLKSTEKSSEINEEKASGGTDEEHKN